MNLADVWLIPLIVIPFLQAINVAGGTLSLNCGFFNFSGRVKYNLTLFFYTLIPYQENQKKST